VSYFRGLGWPQVAAVAVFAIVLAVSLLLGGSLYQRCGFRCDAHGLPVGPVTEMNLKAHPEAALYYPDSKVLESHAYPESTSEVGLGVGSIQTYLEATGKLETPGDSHAIHDWYSAYLTAHGWRADGPPGYQTFARGLRERFEVNFDPNASPTGWLHYSVAYTIAGCRLVTHLHPGVAC
jgi:hypothetical protein